MSAPTLFAEPTLGPSASGPLTAPVLDLYQAIKSRALGSPDAVAVTAPDRAPLCYGRLRDQVEETVSLLNGLGLGRTDRVALVLPNGPEAAAAFLAVASGTTCAPLNPAYQAKEFDFYLSDLRARAVIVQAGLPLPVVDVARARGVAVLELTPRKESEAGIFTLRGEKREGPAQAGFAQPQDLALVLHTSGTTSRPKLVPLTQANICTSARNIQAALRLQPGDRCLNVMPLFHVHGLIGALLSSVWAGASVVCTPGYSAADFSGWLKSFRPTWYTAVPTIHQAILARAAEDRDLLTHFPLRFLRSCSSALAPQVMEQVEKVLQTPIVEAYGMTEASHQIACNPLPPLTRKAGSVGKGTGTTIVILDEAGNPLPCGRTGEVAIRGDNVTGGYESNPAANQSAFSNGFFRTGDQGYLDEEGYLFLTGRSKELINRGGEKIAPREIDEVLLTHPSVAQAVTFAMPHVRLGEEVAAAVVLRRGASATEKDLRVFAATRLSHFKVPRRIVLCDELPKGPTGKLQRIGLAEKLGISRAAFVAPQTPIETSIAEIWARVLQVERVGMQDSFFDLGGHSLLATQLVAELRDLFALDLQPHVLCAAPTVSELAAVIRERLGKRQVEQKNRDQPGLVAIRTGGSRPPLFFLHGLLKGDGFYCHELAHRLGPEQPFYALPPLRAEGSEMPATIEVMAAAHVKAIRSARPSGPYLIAGFCTSGTEAFEVARQLQAQGEEVKLLVLIEAPIYNTGSLDRLLHFATRSLLGGLGWRPEELQGHQSPESQRLNLTAQLGYYSNWWRSFRGQGRKAQLRFLLQKARGGLHRLAGLLRASTRSEPNGDSLVRDAVPADDAENHRRRMGRVRRLATLSYVPRPYRGQTVYLRAQEEEGRRLFDASAWPEVASDLTFRAIPGSHDTCVTTHCNALAEQLRACVNEVSASRGSRDGLGL
jgi:acyl-CoA synthetase (AMP-forming)/AMP-acid ligase II/acyl carrier protein